MNTRPEDVMPWKVNGERWHLGEKGFPPGKAAMGPGDLAAPARSLRKIEPNLEVTWDNRAMN